MIKGYLYDIYDSYGLGSEIIRYLDNKKQSYMDGADAETKRKNNLLNILKETNKIKSKGLNLIIYTKPKNEPFPYGSNEYNFYIKKKIEKI